MKSLLIYFIEMVTISGILYGYYYLFLRDQKFHQYNRYYLLAAVITAILIPLFHIPVYVEPESIIYKPLFHSIVTSDPLPGSEQVPVARPDVPASSRFDWIVVIYYLYAAVVIFFVIRTLGSLLKLYFLTKRYPSGKLGDIYFVSTDVKDTPFSFFNWLFWNNGIDLDSGKGQQVFRHEMYHIRQKHTIDILFMELVTAICWINPFFHLMKRESRAIHEFLADQFAVRQQDKWEYAELLLMRALDTQHRLVNPFFHNQIKRRIAMITNPVKTSHRYLRTLLVLPVLALLTLLCAFSFRKHIRVGSNTSIAQEILKPVDEVMPVLKEKKTARQVPVPNRTIAKRDTVPGVKEVVVTGYQTKKDVVVVGRPRIDSSFRISIANMQEAPLIIIDGKEMTGMTIDKLDYSLNAKSIKSISVLKDASSTSLYGEKGRYGVILITTRKDLEVVKEVPVQHEEVVVTGYQVKRDNIIMEKVEIEVAFPGGANAWKSYVKKNFNSGIPAKEGAKPGNYVAFLRFYVDKDGHAHDIKAVSTHGFGIEEEAVRIVKNVPLWIPAIQNGHTVNAYTTWPVAITVPMTP